MKSISLYFIALLSITIGSFCQSSNKYLGLKPPGNVAEKFAPGIVSKESRFEFGSVFNKAGTEFYYAANATGKDEIRYSKLEGNKWSKHVTILADDRYGYNDPFLSPDENLLFYISRQALDGKGDAKDYDIWYSEKTSYGWSKPINAGKTINTGRNEYYISFTNDGTMYFASNKNAPENNWDNFDIYSSKFINGEFQEPIVLGDAINTEHYEADVFIDPDEAYIIFAASRPDGLGEGDLYISFKQPDGSWSKSKNMGSVVNTSGHELCPYVTYDKKYFLYTSNGDIYWVSAEVFKELR